MFAHPSIGECAKTSISGGEKMIAYVLAKGDAIKPKIASNIGGDLAGALYSGLPPSRLRPLLRSDSAAARMVGVHVVYAAGPYARELIEDVRALVNDPDQNVRHIAGFVLKLAIEYGWVSDG
jgi:hypothetical protein